MKLGNKIAFTIVFIMTMATLAYCLIFRTIILKSFDSLETRLAEQSMERCTVTLKHEVDDLDRLVNDWASWTETYTFADNQNPGFINSNIVPQTYEYLKVNLINIYDKKGGIIWGMAFDPVTGREIHLDLSTELKPEILNRLIKHAGSLNPENGVIRTRYGPMMIASRPILTTNNKGPSHGTLIMGQFLSGHMQAVMSKQAGIDFRILPMGEHEVPGSSASLAGYFSAGNTFKIIKTSPDRMKAYSVIRGLAGEPLVLLEVSLPRDIKDIGKRAHTLGLIFIIGTGFMVLLAISFLLRALFLKPLSALTCSVLSMTESPHDTRRLESLRKDEIGTLSRIFAAMVQRLSRSEQRYRFLAENAHDVIWALNLDMVYIYASPSAENLSGYSAEEIVGKRPVEILTPESFRKAMDLMERELLLEHRNRPDRAGWSRTLELQIIRKDGSPVWTEVTVSFLCDDEGILTGIMGITRDISGRRRAAEEKKKIETQLLQTQKMEALGRFAGGIAHDLNNILYPIIINTETLIQDAEPSSEMHQVLRQILSAAYRQKDLVKHILAFSRKSDQQFSPIRVVPLVEESLNFLRSSLPRTIEIQQHLHASSDTIIGDPTQIEQVIMNLCRNAADSLESGSGTIEVSLANTHMEPGIQTQR